MYNKHTGIDLTLIQKWIHARKLTLNIIQISCYSNLQMHLQTINSIKTQKSNISSQLFVIMASSTGHEGLGLVRRKVRGCFQLPTLITRLSYTCMA